MHHRITLLQSQFNLISDILNAENALGGGDIYDNKGNYERSYSFDNSADFERIRMNMKLKNGEFVAKLTDDDIELITNLLHETESQLIVSTHNPAHRAESNEKLRFVCQIIDYLDSFLPEYA